MTTISAPHGKSTEILAQITAALDAALPPLPVNRNAKRVSVRLPSVLQARIERVRGRMSLPAYASGLVAAWHARAVAATTDTHPLTIANPFAGFGTNRPEQLQYAREIDRRLLPGAIVLAEGSTGIGKGRVLARLAGEHQRVVLAAPSIKVLNQDLDEYDELRKTAMYAPPRLYLGRGNFVSEERVAMIANDLLAVADPGSQALEDAPTAQQRDAAKHALRWLETGAGGASDETRVVREHLPIGHFLARDLRVAAPGFPVDEALLTEDIGNKDGGYEAYRAMREAVLHGTGPIFTTHAALIWNERQLWLAEQRGGGGDGDGLLPSYDFLLVDEAHQLGGAAESAFETSVAIRTLLRAFADAENWKRAKLVTRAKAIIPKIEHIGEALIELAARHKNQPEFDLVFEAKPIMQRLLTLLKPFADVPRTPQTACVHDARLIARQGASSKPDYSVKTTTSQVYHYPSIVTGPRSLTHFWETFWGQLDRAVLASATIYIPRATTTYAATQLAMQLSLPKERIQTMPPVIAPWLLQNVQLITNFDEPTLAPPNQKSPTYVKDFAAWHNAIGARIADLWGSARGGVLVLCTGYDTTEALKKILGATNPCVIEQKRGRFDDAEQAFRARYAAGDKPLWLATAQAWTGLDLRLRDKNIKPADDFLLTDVIIPRVPWGLDRSLIHQMRVAWSQRVEWDRIAMQMRQGIGRLIRTEGLLQRRLVVLDGRIWQKKYKAMLEPIARMLLAYPPH